jgi:hypothetical protein
MNTLLVAAAAAATAVIATTVDAGLASFDRVEAHHYGYISPVYGGTLFASNHVEWNPGDPFDPNVTYGPRPYNNGYQFLTELDEAFIEVSVSSLGHRDHYYLELSPYSVFIFTDDGNDPWPGAAMDIYVSSGDGVVTLADVGAGTFHDRGIIAGFGYPGGWYTPNGRGGYVGDAHVDITSLVNDARSSSIDYLSFRIALPTGIPNANRWLFRTPAVLATDFVIPGPGVGFSVIACVFIGTRRRSA